MSLEKGSFQKGNEMEMKHLPTINFQAFPSMDCSLTWNLILQIGKVSPFIQRKHHPIIPFKHMDRQAKSACFGVLETNSNPVYCFGGNICSKKSMLIACTVAKGCKSRHNAKPDLHGARQSQVCQLLPP